MLQTKEQEFGGRKGIRTLNEMEGFAIALSFPGDFNARFRFISRPSALKLGAFAAPSRSAKSSLGLRRPPHCLLQR